MENNYRYYREMSRMAKVVIDNDHNPDLSDIYNYEHIENSYLFEDIFQYCQNHLNNTFYKYLGIQVYFYFTNNNNFNAFADRNYVIGIDKYVIEKLYNNCFNQNIFLDNDNLIEYRELYNLFINATQKRLNFIMYALSCEFIYYHEFAHLLQFKNKENDKSIRRIVENKEVKESKYNRDRHLEEMDSDILGSSIVAAHVFDIFNLLEESDKNDKNLYKLLSISVACMFSVCRLFENDEITPFYLKESNYPHSYMRAIYMGAQIISEANFKKVLKEFNFDITMEIVNEAIKISNCFFETKYFESYGDYEKEIDEYLKEKKNERIQCKYLVQNHIYLFQI